MRIHSQIASPESRDRVKYPGQALAVVLSGVVLCKIYQDGLPLMVTPPSWSTCRRQGRPLWPKIPPYEYCATQDSANSQLKPSFATLGPAGSQSPLQRARTAGVEKWHF